MKKGRAFGLSFFLCFTLYHEGQEQLAGYKYWKDRG